MNELTKSRQSPRARSARLVDGRGEGELYFRKLLEALPAAAYICDADGHITFFNRQAVKLWGRAPALNDPGERFSGSVRLYTDEGAPLPHGASWMARALQEQRDFFGEPVMVDRPDGTRARALAHASPIRDEQGRVIGAVNVLVDVTEMRNAQQTLRESESRFRRLAETIPAIAWTADADGRLRYINDRWSRYTGVPGGTSMHDWPEGTLHPQDVKRTALAWKRAVESGTEHRIELRLRRHDGVYRWFEARAVPYRDGDGRVVQWFGTTTDVDDPRRAAQVAEFMSRASDELAGLSDYRESLRRIANHAIPAFADWCGIFLVDAAGTVERLTLANADPEKVRFLHEMRDRYPYRPDDPIGPAKVLRTGETCWSDHMSDATLARFAHDARHLELLRKVNFRSWVCVPIHLEGRVGGAMSFVMSDSGRTYEPSHVRVAEDLARRVSMAIRNRELVAAIRESDARKGELLAALRAEQRHKDEFIAMLANELRSPLAPIQNAVQQLRPRPGASPEQPWAREVIERELKRLTRLVQDLHDVARIGRDSIELRRERVQLSSAVNGAVESCRPLLDRSRLQLTVSMPVEPIHVEADLTRLAQVFANLLSNAIKFNELGGRIWVSADREGAHAVVRVRDDGHGIAPDMLERIFEPFFQPPRADHGAQGGLGIGLTLARRLVEMHGGTLSAHSEGLGKGAEFLVRLPAQ